MQQIYTSVTKVLVDSKQGSNLLYLPLDKLIQATGQVSQDVAAVTAPTSAPSVPTPDTSAAVDPRTRDAARTRTRETR
jgi:membrane protease subunit HflK